MKQKIFVRFYTYNFSSFKKNVNKIITAISNLMKQKPLV